MASTVAKSSQRSPVTRISGSSFLLPVIGTKADLKMSDPKANIGHRPSVREIFCICITPTKCCSIRATSAGSVFSGITAYPSVPSQNKN